LENDDTLNGSTGFLKGGISGIHDHLLGHLELPVCAD
jgi:hypothetical protein